MKTLAKLVLAACGAVGVAGVANAATATANFNVTATVQSTCSVTATNLAFGNYDAASATPLDQSSTITVSCTNGTTYGVDVGLNPTARSMAGPSSSVLNYGMFSDAARTTGFLVAAPTASTGVAVPYTVYGRIPAGQYAAKSGAHTATVTATVTY